MSLEEPISPNDVFNAIKNKFSNIIKESEIVDDKHLIQFKIDGKHIVSFATFLKDEMHFIYPLHITAVDYPEDNELEMVYHFVKVNMPYLVRVKFRVPRDNPSVDSIAKVWPAANWFERETYDMFGVKFRGHPDLRRILLPQDWVGHPLRKDYKMDEDYHWEKQVKEYYNPYEEKGWLGVPVSDTEMIIQIGPQHPTLHGTWKLVIKVDGDTIVDAWPDIGFIHRGIEKLAEQKRYEQILPMTDRLCYATSMEGNVLYIQLIEKLMGIEVPLRAQYIRTIALELQRITSHLLWLGAYMGDLGTFHAMFLYPLREREYLLDLFEMLTGARLTYTYPRLGGVKADIPDGWLEKVKKTLDHIEKHLPEYHDMTISNEAFVMRTKGVGVLPKEVAAKVGARGPVLRASGIKHDTRKTEPYLIYGDLDFEIPTCKDGDCFCRYLVRVEEIMQSINIVRQAIEKIPSGEYRAKARAKAVEGEASARIEASRGEYLMYVVGRKKIQPYRLAIESPAYMNISTVPYMLRGARYADLAAIVGSIDVCMAEVDR